MTLKEITYFVTGLGKKSLHSRATELFFNDGMPQKMHWTMRRFWLHLTLEPVPTK